MRLLCVRVPPEMADRIAALVRDEGRKQPGVATSGIALRRIIDAGLDVVAPVRTKRNSRTGRSHA
jgi:predicted DNA-binding protein